MVVLILKFQERCADKTCRQVVASTPVKPYPVHYQITNFFFCFVFNCFDLEIGNPHNPTPLTV